MHEEEKKTLAKLFAKMFIARPDIRAVQRPDGQYRPLQQAFDMPSLISHIDGTASYGHYMVSQEGKVKLFAIDVDLWKTGPLPQVKDWNGEWDTFIQGNPRELWMSRLPGPARDMIKFQLRMIGNELARIVQSELEIPVAVAYSGSKGIHIYGFTGPTSAKLARDGARIVLDATGKLDLHRGNNIFRYKPNEDLVYGYPQYELEIYPKQDSTDHLPEHLGNLMRLPCGTNLKSPRDGAFFLDLRAPLAELAPMNPIEALTTSDPWR